MNSSQPAQQAGFQPEVEKWASWRHVPHKFVKALVHFSSFSPRIGRPQDVYLDALLAKSLVAGARVRQSAGQRGVHEEGNAQALSLFFCLLRLFPRTRPSNSRSVFYSSTSYTGQVPVNCDNLLGNLPCTVYTCTHLYLSEGQCKLFTTCTCRPNTDRYKCMCGCHACRYYKSSYRSFINF